MCCMLFDWVTGLLVPKSVKNAGVLTVKARESHRESPPPFYAVYRLSLNYGKVYQAIYVDTKAYGPNAGCMYYISNEIMDAANPHGLSVTDMQYRIGPMTVTDDSPQVLDQVRIGSVKSDKYTKIHYICGEVPLPGDCKWSKCGRSKPKSEAAASRDWVDKAVARLRRKGVLIQ